jgi:type I restriction enzyme, S subunit
VPPEPVPAGWAWSRLADIAELRTGHTPSRSEPDYWDGDIPWIGITDARENYGKIINDTAQHITLAGLNNSSAEILPLDTICLSRTASLGYVVFTGAPMATSQDFLNWTCGDQLDRDWLLWLFIAERDGWQNFGRGSTHKTIYMEDADRLYVLLPPLDEQHEIVNFIEASTRRVETIVGTIASSEAAAIRARDETIDAALQGKLATGDVRDESADILLGELEDDIEVTRTEAAADVLEDQAAPVVSVDRLIDVVAESAEGLSPEKLFLSAGYRANTLDTFFAHIKSAVAVGAVRYDAARDRVVADET